MVENNYYERKIKYLDLMVSGERAGGAGFIKTEVRGMEINLAVTVKGLHSTDTYEREVMLQAGDGEFSVGKITLREGQGQFKYHAVMDYTQLQGIRIALGGAREIRCRLQESRRASTAASGAVRSDADRNKEAYSGTADQKEVGEKSRPGKLQEIQVIPWDEIRAVEESLERVEKMRAKSTAGEMYEAAERRPEREAPTEKIWKRNAFTEIGREREASAESAWEREPSTERIWEKAASAESTQERETSAESARRREASAESVRGRETSAESARGREASAESVRGREASAESARGREASAESARRRGSSVESTWGRGNFAESVSERSVSAEKMTERDTISGRAAQGQAKMGRRADRESDRAAMERISRRELKTEGTAREYATGETAGTARERMTGETAGKSGRNSLLGREKKPVRLMENKWQQIWAIYPHIHPFQDEREYLSIGPADFVLLPEEAYRAANNSFLLHGYYNYDHLILTKIEKRGEVCYYIGVPGNYYEREKQVAVMFGFESFECGTEPAQAGDFGYYMMRTQL